MAQDIHNDLSRSKFTPILLNHEVNNPPTTALCPHSFSFTINKGLSTGLYAILRSCQTSPLSMNHAKARRCSLLSQLYHHLKATRSEYRELLYQPW